MRYVDGGGLTVAGRAKREAVGFEAAEMFELGVRPPEVARRLRVSQKSAYAWREGGIAALSSKGLGGFLCQFGDVQVERLRAELEAGSAAHGWTEDQWWTPARVAELIHGPVRLSVHPAWGVAALTGLVTADPRAQGRRVRCAGSGQVADGAVVTGKRTAQLLGAWILFEGEAGQDLKPGKGRTWSRWGRTPLVTVVGKGSGRVLTAGLICVRPGHETRLIYRTQTYRGRAGEKKSFRVREFVDLLTSARRQLGDVPLIVARDNAIAHYAKPLREFCERDSD